MAARLKAAGYRDEDVRVFVPDGHPKEGGLLAVLHGSDTKAKAILMMVSGSSKCEILARLIDRDPRLPATSLMAHRDFTILADPDALKLVDLRSGGRKLGYDGVL